MLTFFGLYLTGCKPKNVDNFEKDFDYVWECNGKDSTTHRVSKKENIDNQQHWPHYLYIDSINGEDDGCFFEKVGK